MKPRKPLPPRATRLRRSPIKKRKPKPKAWEMPEYRTWIRTQLCCIWWVEGHECSGQVQAVHVRAKHLGHDRDNLVPMDGRIHIEELHRHGCKTFAKKWGIDLASDAIKYQRRYDAERAAAAWSYLIGVLPEGTP